MSDLEVTFLELVGPGDIQFSHQTDEGWPGVARQPTHTRNASPRNNIFGDSFKITGEV